MNKSVFFKTAHKLARKVIKFGDNYAVTFGACLKLIANMSKNYKSNLVANINNGFDGLVFRPTPKGICAFLTNSAKGTMIDLTALYGRVSKNPAKYFLTSDGQAKSLEMTIIIATVQAMLKV